MRKRLTEFLPRKADLKMTPVLAESPASRYFSFSLLYFAQGVPEGLTFFAIPAWLALNDVSPIVIGSYLAMVTLPWSLKLILAPLMDRFTIQSMGRKRPWVIFGQIGLVLSFISLSTLNDPLNHIPILMASGFTISLFGCFQDVATDGMAVDIIPIEEQARANGLMWGSKVIGISASLAAGTYMINQFGFSNGVLVPAVFTSALILVPVFFVERRGEKRFPWSFGQASLEAKLLQVGNFKQFLLDTYRVATRFSSIVLSVFMFLAGAVVAYMDTLLPIFTIQKLAWTNDEYSNLLASASILGGVLGMFVGGALVDFFGKKKMLLVYTLFWLISFVGFLFFNSDWFSDTVASILIFALTAGVVFSSIATLTICMTHCWKRVSATQFTLYMTLNNVGRSAGSGMAGYVKEYFDWYTTFTFGLVVLVLAMVLIGFLRIKKQLKTIERLEKEALEKLNLEMELSLP